MNQFISLSPHRRAAMVLSMLLVFVTVGCAPAVGAILVAPPTPTPSHSSAPLQLVIFHSPL